MAFSGSVEEKDEEAEMLKNPQVILGRAVGSKGEMHMFASFMCYT